MPSLLLPAFAPDLPPPMDVWALPVGERLAMPEDWQDQTVGAVSAPALGHYPAPAGRATGTAVIVCPGGGYNRLAMEHEGVTVAQWLNSLGVDAFVLKSRLRHHGHPAPLRDVCAALRRVRARAPQLRLRTDRIGIIGFSAGGHLAASACTWHADPAAADPAPAFATVSARPDFSLLLYPVISFEAPEAHLGSRASLLGANPTPVLVASLSLHRRVNANTPPACLVHAQDDSTVPVENSRLYFAALRAAGVASALHVYPRGGHGFGLGRATGLAAQWPDGCADWLRTEGWLT